MDTESRPTRRTVLAGAGAGAVALSVAACSPCGGGDAAGTPVAGGRPLVALGDVPVGGSVSATVAGKPVLVAQPEAGKVVAFSAICTHMGCTVAPAGKEFHCPCHGSVYDAATGQVLRGPAPRPLPTVTVRVQGDEVVTG